MSKPLNIAKTKCPVQGTHSRIELSSSQGALELQVCFTASFPLMLPISTFSFLSASFLNHIWMNDKVTLLNIRRLLILNCVVLLPFQQRDINEMYLHHCKTRIGNRHFHFSSACSFPSFLYSMFLFLPLPANSQNVLIKNLRNDIVLESAAGIKPYLAPWRTVGQPRKSPSCLKCLFIIICSYLA